MFADDHVFIVQNNKQIHVLQSNLYNMGSNLRQWSYTYCQKLKILTKQLTIQTTTSDYHEMQQEQFSSTWNTNSGLRHFQGTSKC